jgi:hypothetical protein
MSSQNKGYFIPTTQTWDVTEIYQTDVNSDKFKELMVRMYQQLGNMAQQINSKGSGLHNTQEFATGATFYANPANSSAGPTKAAPRPIFRKTINMLPTGTLPNTGTLTVAHDLTLNSACTLVKLYGAATNAAGTSMMPLPYASPVLNADATNIYLVTGKDQTAYTKCNVIIEFLKN